MELQDQVCRFLADKEPDELVQKEMLLKLDEIKQISKEVKKFVRYLLFFEQFDEKTTDKHGALEHKEEALQLFVENDLEEMKEQLKDQLAQIRLARSDAAKDELLNLLFERLSKSRGHRVAQNVAPNYAVKRVLRARGADEMKETLDLKNT